MKRLLFGLLIACAGCGIDTHLMTCEIAYTDGEVERIACNYAYVDEPVFGRARLLKIVKGGNVITRSLSMIKRWDLKTENEVCDGQQK